MNKITVEARLDIEVWLYCPNSCGYLINLLDSNDTNGKSHDDDGGILRQVFSKSSDYDDFECDEVTCSQCKAEFNVRGLER